MINSTTVYPVIQEWSVLSLPSLISMIAFEFVWKRVKRNGFHYV